MDDHRVFCLVGAVKHYLWGKLGKKGLVGQLASIESNINEELPYAEIWFGTHPSGEARVILPLDSQESHIALSECLKQNPHFLCDHKYLPEPVSTELPFILKVLSIDIPLSIQVHPDRKFAQILHQKYPDIYKDAQHKPEMAISLSHMKLMCGFRPIDHILVLIKSIKSLRSLVGESLILELQIQLKTTRQREILHDIFLKVLNTPLEYVKYQIKELFENLSELDKLKGEFGFSDSDISDLEQALRQVQRCFPEDVGLFCLFFLNYIQLSPGEAIFLFPNEPHAYISGDCIECMATSDNVIRAALTSKFKDIDTFSKILTYNCGNISIFKGKKVENINFPPQECIYAPPVSEFQVGYFDIDISVDVPAISKISILLVIDGSGFLKTQNQVLNFKKGSCFLIIANVSFTLVPEKHLKAYRACESFFYKNS